MHAGSESSLLYLSSEHGERKANEIVISLGNTTHVRKVVKLIPVSVTLPNIFPNVNQYKNTWREGVDPTLLSIPEGQYDVDSLVVALNAASGDFTFSHNGTSFVITNVSGGTTAIRTTSSDLFELLGFQDQIVKGTTEYVLSFASSDVFVGGLPNLGGEKVVFVMSHKLAHANMCFGGDGTQYDCVAHVDFTQTDYGQSSIFRVDDIDAHDIDFYYHNNLDVVTLYLYDSRFRDLILPNNYHLRIVLRAHHKDTKLLSN